jgi:hypothetical protein
MHPAGTRKADYLWRLTAMDRAMQAGVDDVGIGALFGLYDWRFEVLALVAHDGEASGWLWVMVGILILFNPLVPLHLRRDTWRVLDLLAAGIFVAAAFKLQTHPSRQKREVS